MQNAVSENRVQYIITQRWFSLFTFQISDKAGKIIFLLKGRMLKRCSFQDATGNEIFIIKHKKFFQFNWDNFEMEIYGHNTIHATTKETTRGLFSAREFLVTLIVEQEEMLVKYQRESFLKGKYIFSREHEDVAVLSPLRSFWGGKYLMNIRENQNNALMFAIAMTIIFGIKYYGYWEKRLWKR